MKQTWEYKTHPIRAGVIEKDLNEMGQQGWELVTMWFRSSSDILAVFKRVWLSS